MDWVLVLFIYAGPFAHGDSVALIKIENMEEAACKAAGVKMSTLVKNTAKEVRFTCVSRHVW